MAEIILPPENELTERRLVVLSGVILRDNILFADAHHAWVLGQDELRVEYERWYQDLAAQGFRLVHCLATVVPEAQKRET